MLLTDRLHVIEIYDSNSIEVQNGVVDRGNAVNHRSFGRGTQCALSLVDGSERNTPNGATTAGGKLSQQLLNTRSHRSLDPSSARDPPSRSRRRCVPPVSPMIMMMMMAIVLITRIDPV